MLNGFWDVVGVYLVEDVVEVGWDAGYIIVNEVYEEVGGVSDKADCFILYGIFYRLAYVAW